MNHIPADLDAFWTRTLDRARREPLDASLEQVPERVPYFIYRLRYTSLDGVPVRARLSLPADTPEPGRPPRWPVVVTVPGYGGWEMAAMPADCQRGCAVLQVYPRGMGESGELWKVPEGCEGAWIKVGAHNPEGFYYQGAYLDMVRGVDYLVSRPDIDAERIGVMGTSGGGMLALGLAAIDPRVRAVVANEPALCNFRYNPALAANAEASDPVFLNTFDYFESLHMATRITAPALLISGGQDRTCTPESIRQVYDNITGIKSLLHLPYMPHGTTRHFYNASWEWLARYCLT